MGCQQVHTPLGRGRCFIRAALNAKIISVPVEQLGKNHKLTNVSTVTMVMCEAMGNVALTITTLIASCSW